MALSSATTFAGSLTAEWAKSPLGTASAATTPIPLHPHAAFAQTLGHMARAAFVDPIIDVANLAKLYPRMALETAQGMLGVEIVKPMDLTDPEVEGHVRKALKGAALLNAGAITGPISGAVAGPIESIGARAIAKGVAPTISRIAVGATKGVAEGLAFGSVFGTLDPIDSPTKSRLDHIAATTIASAIFGGVLRGIGVAIKDQIPATAGMAPPSPVPINGRYEELIAGTQPMPPAPMGTSELVAQVAAGSTGSGAGRSGFFNHLHSAARSVLDVIQTRFPEVKGFDQSAWMAGLRAADAKTLGAWFGKRTAQYVTQGMGDEEKDLFVKGLMASRGRQIRASLLREAEQLRGEQNSKATLTINGKEYDEAGLKLLAKNITLPVLTEEEQNLFNLSPAIQRAKQRYATEILPQLTEIRVRNGLSVAHFAETDEPFLPLIGASDADVAAGLAHVSVVPPTGTGVEGTFTAPTTKGAMRATGTASAYVKDFEALMTRAFGRDFHVDRKNELLFNVITAPWARPLAKGERANRTIMFNGKEVPAVAIPIRGNPNVFLRNELAPEIIGVEGEGLPGEIVENVLGYYEVPRSIGKMLNELYNPLDRDLSVEQAGGNMVVRGLFKALDFLTGLQLASPVEAAAHSGRIINTLAGLPGIGNDQGALAHLANAFVPYFGPRLSALRSIYAVYDSPAASAMEARLAGLPGGLPTRAFEAEMGPTKGGVLHAGRRFLFGLPEQEKGFAGLDIRARIAAGLTLDNITKAHLGRPAEDAELLQFITQFGQYSDAVQSNLAVFLRKNRLNPFAGGQAGFIPGEIRRMFGGLNLPRETVEALSKESALKLRAETLYRGVIGASLMMVAAQKALTDSYPWENERGHQMDLRVGYTEDGRAVYIPAASWEPGVARAFRITGARTMVEALGENSVSEEGRNLMNTALTYGIGAPGIAAGTTLLTGRTPFLTSSGELMASAPPEPTSPLTIKERFLHAAGASNPSIENLLGVGTAEALPLGVRIVNALTPGMTVGRDPMMAVSADVRARRGQMMDIVEDRVNRGLKKYPNVIERMNYYREESMKFPGNPNDAYREMLRADQGRRIGRAKAFSEALRGR